jgi:hypothetical protein
MSTYYAVVSALIFAIVAVAHAIRLVNRWAVQVGPFAVPMSISWIGLRCSDLGVGLRAVSPLGQPVRNATCPAVSRRARLIFDHAPAGCAQRPTGTISCWYPHPLQRFRRPLFSRAIASLWTVCSSMRAFLRPSPNSLRRAPTLRLGVVP